MNAPAPEIPRQPVERDWRFVEELRTRPYHERVVWTPRAARRGELSFAGGIRLDPAFPDPSNALETAYADFRRFLGSVGLAPNGGLRILTVRAPTSVREEHRVGVYPDRCEISAADADGIRRGLVWIEDEMCRRGGPFLPLGSRTRTPLIRTRISRCFYGPINRPPKFKDELADDTDYYPEEYLNRLAHQGVNALWMTMHFFQTVPSRIIPEYGRHAGPRLDKLRRTVAKCGRYGIRIYPFCIEPAAFTWSFPEVAAAAAAHPELRGHGGAFCTSTETGRAYLEEATRTLFTEVPGLGGLIVIPVGERLTNCYSWSIPDGGSWPAPNTCPRCSERRPEEVVAELLDVMAGGMHRVDPEAELVAWPYGQWICWGPERMIGAAAETPPTITLQHNFETGGTNVQLGRPRLAWDYWLSYVGPSTVFADCARAAASRGARVSAKLQVGCSHEVATTQVVPAPGLLYRKYREMHRLGVSTTMLSWFFGSYPSIMTRAAGELSFAPFPRTERAFLLSLARRDWGPHARAVARAWRWFLRGYSQYPTAHIFGYFGPMHDGPVWPLHLIPRRRPLAPTWQICYPPSGDYIAECVTNGFTLREILVLCRRMARRWRRGVRILETVERHVATEPERVREIGVAKALGLQFLSGHHILEFYAIREELAEARRPASRTALLQRMRRIVEAEIEVDNRLLPLAESDTRLGFHSEAEGYKYFPDLIRWRAARLRDLLEREFPAVTARARNPEPLFPEYTGERPAGAVYECGPLDRRPESDGEADGPAWEGVVEVECSHWLRPVFDIERWRRCGYDGLEHVEVPESDRARRRTLWRAGTHDGSLYLCIRCTAGSRPGEEAFAGESVQVSIEPVRTRPRMVFSVGPEGVLTVLHDDGYVRTDPAEFSRVSCRRGEAVWSATLRLPLRSLGLRRRGGGWPPVRLNVLRTVPAAGNPGRIECSWARRQPAQGRLVWGYLNPATDFGWLRLTG